MARDVTIDIRAKTGQYERKLKSARNSTAQFGSSIDGMAAKAAKLGTGAAIAGVAALGAAVVGIGIKSATAFAGFEKSLSQIEGLVGVAHDEVVGFQDTILELSVKTARPAQELADALFFITSAGLEGADALDALDVSAQAAAAGLGDTAIVADVVTSAMNAYGPSTLSAAQATDVLVAAVREGKAAAPELSASLGQVIPIASQMGVSFDQVGAAIAAMTRTGLNAAEASTALKSILTSILAPTTDAAKALDDMGLSAMGLQTQIQAQGLFATLETLNEAFDGNTEATTRVFGNVRALTGVMSLMGSNADATADIFDSLESSTGALDHAFGTASDTGAFAFEQAKVRIENAMLAVGKDILPQLADAMDSVAPHIEELVAGIGELAIMAVEFGTNAVPFLIDGIAVLEKTLINSQVVVQRVRQEWAGFVDVMDIAVGPLINFGDQFNELQEDHLAWLRTQARTVDILRNTGDASHAATNALLQLADSTAINEERTEALGDQLGLTDQEMLDAAQYAYDYAEANGASEAKLGSLTIAIAHLEEALQGEQRERALAQGAARNQALAAYYAAEAAEAEADVITGDLNPALSTLESMLLDAEAAQTSLTEAIKIAADPAFKAVKAVEKLRDAEQKLADVQDDEKASAEELAQAQLDIVTATLDAQTALDGVTPDALEAALRGVTEALGLSDDEARDLFETLGLLDGTSVKTIIEVETIETTRTRERRANVLSAKDRLGTFATGGVVPGAVGEPMLAIVHGGEEVLTPEMRRANSTTNNSNRQVNLTIVSPQTQDLTGDIADGLLRASVIEQVDFLGGM